VLELPWSQRAPRVFEKDLDATLEHEEEFVRVSVEVGPRAGRPCGNEHMEERVVIDRRLAGGEKVDPLPHHPVALHDARPIIPAGFGVTA
jgi:hypothetical protein